MIFSTSIENASMVEWSITTDCKSVAFGLRRFESYSTHNVKRAWQEVRLFLHLVFVELDSKDGKTWDGTYVLSRGREYLVECEWGETLYLVTRDRILNICDQYIKSPTRSRAFYVSIYNFNYLLLNYRH